ncbi:FHA domain-containing protein [Demequina sp. NBRC 110056]|uniref:FHA domain-containing protein n=1 Tax=Demequina sp. NBRC 110056 TaxID=1570345 RepID=UPI000A049504|nr:FHA domain-containing protein [Demequina sp. NBRC 110056]
MFAYAVGGPDVPGYAVVTDSFLVLLSADAPAETVRAVHRLLDSPAASASAAIARLSAADGASRFAVVEIVDPWTQEFHVSVRGDVRVDMGGASTTRFTWPHGDELLTGEADGVETLHLALSDVPAEAASLPLRHGAVLANAIFLDAMSLGADAEAAEASHDTLIARPDEPGTGRRGRAAAPGGHGPAKAAPPRDDAAASAADAADAADSPGAAPSSTPPAAAAPPQAAPPRSAARGDASPASASALPDGAAASAEAASPDIEQAPAPDAVDARPRPVDLASLMASSPPRLWTLTLPDGNELYAAPQIVVGRRPWRSSPDETQTYYVKAPSPHRQISSKHVEFTVSGGQLSARDLGSTNGTVVESPNRPPRLLRDGNSTRLDVGDVLDLGEGFRIVVGARPGS